MITLTFQLTASLLQPWVGYYTDRHPKPWLLPMGSLCTLIGILMLAFIGTFPAILPASTMATDLLIPAVDFQQPDLEDVRLHR